MPNASGQLEVGTDESYLDHIPCDCDYCIDLGQYAESNPSSSRLFACISETAAGTTAPYDDEEVILYMAEPRGDRVRHYHFADCINEMTSPSGLVTARHKARERGILRGCLRPEAESVAGVGKFKGALERLKE